jgi:hypothetical protein
MEARNMAAVIRSIWHLPAFFCRHIHQSMGLLAATADVVAQLELSLADAACSARYEYAWS